MEIKKEKPPRKKFLDLIIPQKRKRKEKNMKKIKKTKINLFNIVVIVSMLGAAALLIHDFIFWGFIPMFTGEAYALTYFGLFMDLIAIAVLEASIQLIKEW